MKYSELLRVHLSGRFSFANTHVKRASCIKGGKGMNDSRSANTKTFYAISLAILRNYSERQFKFDKIFVLVESDMNGFSLLSELQLAVYQV